VRKALALVIEAEPPIHPTPVQTVFSYLGGCSSTGPPAVDFSRTTFWDLSLRRTCLKTPGADDEHND
jgi:hypothetical protein